MAVVKFAYRHTQGITRHAREELPRVNASGFTKMHAVILLLERQQHVEHTVASAAHKIKLPPKGAQRVTRVAQRAAHGRGGIRHQSGHALLRGHRQLQHQHPYEHAWRVQIPPPAPVQRWHADHHAVAPRHASKVQRQGRQEKAEYGAFLACRLLTQQSIGGALERLHQRMGPRQSRAPRGARAALQQGSRQLRNMPFPVRRVARERLRVSVRARFLHEPGVAESRGWRQGTAFAQHVVQITPLAHHLRRAPAVHHGVVKLHDESMQTLMASQHGKTPGRCAVQRKRLAGMVLPPILHRLQRFNPRSHFNHRQGWIKGIEQDLPPLRQRGQPQSVVQRDQFAQRFMAQHEFQRPVQKPATTNHQVAASRPGRLVEPHLLLAQRQGYCRPVQVDGVRSHRSISFIA